MREDLWLFLVPLLVAWIVTDRSIPWVWRVAHRWNWLDQPDARKIHTTPIARLGGIAIFGGFLTAIGTVVAVQPSALPSSSVVWGYLAGAAVVFLLGAIDDFKPLPATLKLVVQILAAGLALFLAHGTLGAFALPMLALPFAMLWLVGTSNTVNLVDGMDGLAGSLAMGATFLVAALAWHGQHWEVALVAVTILGALAGFLRHNWNPARIFMGDSGSLFLGFMLASMTLMVTPFSVSPLMAVIPLLIMSLPLLDTALAIIRRLRLGRHIFSPDREHLHHRLLSLGLSQRRTVLLLNEIALLAGSGALWAAGVPNAWAVTGLALGALSLDLSHHWLRRGWRLPVQEASRPTGATKTASDFT